MQTAAVRDRVSPGEPHHGREKDLDLRLMPVLELVLTTDDGRYYAVELEVKSCAAHAGWAAIAATVDISVTLTLCVWDHEGCSRCVSPGAMTEMLPAAPVSCAPVTAAEELAMSAWSRDAEHHHL